MEGMQLTGRGALDHACRQHSERDCGNGDSVSTYGSPVPRRAARKVSWSP